MKWFGRRSGREESRPVLARVGGARLGEWASGYEAQVRAAYLENPVAQRAVRLVAESVAAAEIDASEPALEALVRERSGGHAALFDRVDRGGDVMRRGAFAGAGPVPLLWQHRGTPAGRIVALGEDAAGLWVEGEIEAREAARLVAAGAVSGLSVGYRARVVQWGTYRELLRVDLAEVSLVAQPMQPRARIESFEWIEGGVA